MQCVCICLVAWRCLHSQWSKCARIMLDHVWYCMIMRVTTKRSGIASALVFRVQVQVTPVLWCHVPACATVSPQLSPLRRSECDIYNVMKFWTHRKKAFPLVLVLGCIYLHVWRLLLGLVCLLICLLPLEALIKPFDNNDRGVTFVMWYSHQEVIREVERIPSTLSSLTNQPQPEQGPGWDNGGEIGGTTDLGRWVWQKLDDYGIN